MTQPPREDSPQGWSRLYETELTKRAETIESDFDAAFSGQMVLSANVIGPEYANRAGRLILTLAISDLDDLLHEVRRGAGRAAMRSARSLIEHSVNMGSVLANERDAERYLDHLNLGPILMAQTSIHLLYLDKRERQRVEHELKKDLREANAAWEAALREYGGAFRRAWHPRPLSDRAKEQDAQRLYELYRIASNVAHGSAAGSFGHYYIARTGRGSYSIGRVPELVPLAMLTGVDAYLEMLKHLRDYDDRIDISGAWDILLAVTGMHYLEVRAAARAAVRKAESFFDAELGFSSVYLVFSRQKRTRWYFQLSQMSSKWYRAVETPRCADWFERVEPLLDAYIRDVGEFNEGGLAAIELRYMALPVDIEKPAVPGDAIFPRLVPASDDLSSWTIVSGLDPDGSYVVEGGLLAEG